MNPTKLLAIAALCLCLFARARAQDTIALKSGRVIIAPIDEVGEEYVIYVKLDENHKPQSKTVAVADIRRINYKNGYVERYGKKEDAYKDKIVLLNGRSVEYKVVEVNDNAVVVDAGRKDSTILLRDVSAIAYANGNTDRYNESADSQVPVAGEAVRENAVASVPVFATASTRPKFGEAPKLPNDKLSPPALFGKSKSGKAKSGEVINVNSSDKATLGIGYVIDSLSNISNQFYLYDLLVHNEMVTNDNKKIVPVLTLRRGLCDYYLTGTIRSPRSTFYLLEKGEPKATIVINTGSNFVYNDMLKQLYVKIDEAVSGQSLNAKSVKVSFPEMPVTDFASTKPIKYNVLLNAANYTPPLDDYAAMSREYLKPMADIDTATLSKLTSNSFIKLSQKNKNKNASYVRYASVLDEYTKVLPQYPELPISAGKSQMPMYWISENLKSRNMGVETIKYLECVYPLYTSNKLKGFFFESPLVDEQAKSAAKNAILPLYKRPGAVLTYLQCGKNFAREGATDVAIESLSSGLLIVDNLNTTASFKEYLKAALFIELSAAYVDNNQLASAVICKGLADFHTRLYNSHLYDTDNQNMRDNTLKLTGYFEKVEADALEARSKKRSAFWSGIGNLAASLGSAYVDAKSGSTTPSETTVALASNATDNLSLSTDIQQASLSNTAMAAQAFNENFAQIMEQMHYNNALGGERPIFSMDFIELLSDKYSVDALGSNLNDFLQSVPYLQSSVNQYLSAANAKSKNPITLNDIYAKFWKLETDINTTEAYGAATSQKDLYDYH